MLSRNLVERIVGVLGIFRDFGIGQPSQRTVLEHDWPKALEPRTPERRILCKQEIAAPKTLSRDCPVRLSVDGEENTRCVSRLRHATHQHQNVAVRVRVHCSGAQRFLLQRHRIVIGVVVARRRSSGSGVNAVGDGAHIIAERRRKSRPLCALAGLDACPAEALWRFSCAAARALRKAERQSHFERKIRAQKVGKIGAIGTKNHLHLVFTEAEMIEQDVSRSIAQHFVQGRPRRRRIERCIEKLLDPCRKQIFSRAIPRIAKGPDTARRRAWSRGLVPAHRDLARAVAARASARERRAPCPRGGGRHLSEPEIWWSAEALTRLRRKASIRRNQREFTFDRALGGKDDSQRGAFPRRNRRRQNCNVSILAGTFGLSRSSGEGKNCTCDQQWCCRGSGKACCKQLSPLPEQIVGVKQDTRSVQAGNRPSQGLNSKFVTIVCRHHRYNHRSSTRLRPLRSRSGRCRSEPRSPPTRNRFCRPA